MTGPDPTPRKSSGTAANLLPTTSPCEARLVPTPSATLSPAMAMPCKGHLSKEVAHNTLGSPKLPLGQLRGHRGPNGPWHTRSGRSSPDLPRQHLLPSAGKSPQSGNASCVLPHSLWCYPLSKEVALSEIRSPFRTTPRSKGVARRPRFDANPYHYLRQAYPFAKGVAGTHVKLQKPLPCAGGIGLVLLCDSLGALAKGTLANWSKEPTIER